METILRGANTKVISRFLTKSLQTNFLVKYTQQSSGAPCLQSYYGSPQYKSPTLRLAVGGKSTVSLQLATIHNWLRIVEEGSEIGAVFLLLFHPINNNEDFSHPRHAISLVEDWVKCNHLTLNIAKCKYMVILRKRNPSLPLHELERVTPHKTKCREGLRMLLSLHAIIPCLHT